MASLKTLCRQPVTSAFIGLLVAAALFTPVSAGLVHTDIEVDGNTYRYEFEAMIAAPLEATHAVITDHEALKHFNDGVLESDVLETYADGALKRKLLVEQCVLVFCFDLRFIEKVEARGNQQIVATIIPEESNFRRGTATWMLEPIGKETTKLRVIAEQEPDFWIPPVIGPAVIKHVFREEIRETAENIESAAINRDFDG